MTPAGFLSVRNVSSSYGGRRALFNVSLDIGRGELVALVGANGAGKTTLLHCLSGVQPIDDGEIVFEGRNIAATRASERVGMGIAQVPEGRLVFAGLTIEDNLLLGTYRREAKARRAAFERVYAMFPILRERHRQLAGTLSGGQQQMLALARALVSSPKLLLLDEPSMGLAPTVVQHIFDALDDLLAVGTTILLVDQNASAALAMADRGYVIETGKIVLSGTGEALLDDERVKSAYLGA